MDARILDIIELLDERVTKMEHIEPLHVLQKAEAAVIVFFDGQYPLTRKPIQDGIRKVFHTLSSTYDADQAIADCIRASERQQK